MAGVVTTSLVVQFGEGADQYHLSAEIDGRPDGLNKGVTNFLPGDSPYFLVYKSPELALQLITSTGSVAAAGQGQVEIEEFLTFANVKSVELPKPPSGIVDLEHFAGVTGAKVSGSTVSLPQPGVAVYRATYQAKYYAYQMRGIPLTLKGESTFPVVVVIIGTAA